MDIMHSHGCISTHFNRHLASELIFSRKRAMSV
jgi:hypothetical protein